MKIYLDTCCYNRPFDDLSQERVRIESEIILNIMQKGIQGELEIVGSDIVKHEIMCINDLVKKQRVLDLFANIQLYVSLDQNIENRAKQIKAQTKIRTYDSLQIASAEAAHADVMLTTDDKLEKLSKDVVLKIRVMNPVKFLIETLYGGENNAD